MQYDESLPDVSTWLNAKTDFLNLFITHCLRLYIDIKYSYPLIPLVPLPLQNFFLTFRFSNWNEFYGTDQQQSHFYAKNIKLKVLRDTHIFDQNSLNITILKNFGI